MPAQELGEIARKHVTVIGFEDDGRAVEVVVRNNVGSRQQTLGSLIIVLRPSRRNGREIEVTARQRERVVEKPQERGANTNMVVGVMVNVSPTTA